MDTGFLAPIGSVADSNRQTIRQCQSDERVIAIRAQSNSVINYMAMACAKTSDINANIAKPPVTWRYLGGAGGGDEGGRRLCPTGMAIKGIHGRSGARIDELRVICEDEIGLAQEAPFELPLRVFAMVKANLGFALGKVLWPQFMASRVVQSIGLAGPATPPGNARE